VRRERKTKKGTMGADDEVISINVKWSSTNESVEFKVKKKTEFSKVEEDKDAALSRLTCHLALPLTLSLLPPAPSTAGTQGPGAEVRRGRGLLPPPA